MFAKNDYESFMALIFRDCFVTLKESSVTLKDI